MRVQPKTAQEALEIWKAGDKYLGDTDPGGSDPDEVFAAANRTIQLAKIEDIPLEQLAPDAATRQRLEDHAAEFDKIETAEEEGWASMDPPPNEDEFLQSGDADFPDEEEWEEDAME